MAVFLLSLIVFLAVFAALATGVIAGRAPIKGSCGGLAGGKHIECSECPRRATCNSAERHP